MNGAKIRLVVTFIVFLPSKRAVGRRVGRLAAGRAARAQCRPEFRRAHTPRHHHPPAATMVYESDFYTTRRPYRPVTSTYSTSYGSSGMVRHPRREWRVARAVSPPYHIVVVRAPPSLTRLLRPVPRRIVESPAPGESFLRSSTVAAWEDDAKRLRADTATLLKRARTPVPRAPSPVPLRSVISSYARDLVVPFHFAAITGEHYVSQLISPLRHVTDRIRTASWFTNPVKKFTGRGNLACVHYSGAKAFSSRRPLYSSWSVRDDVNLLSFYAKNRLAAAGLATESAAARAQTRVGSSPPQPPALPALAAA